MTWKLSRPEPALPSSYFWTWDHSTNWVLDDPGLLTFGCHNKYMKRPETYVEDYRRLTDLASGLGIAGIIIWGFLRDSHGGIESSKRVADYARSKGVAITPGLGTTWYGGVYYEGNHRYNLETFLRKNPDARMINDKGEPQDHGVCSTNPAFIDWIQEAAQWLFSEFAVGGANLENGDFLVCHDPGCKENKKSWPKEDPDFFRLQALGYKPALDGIEKLLPDNLVTWATYCGFMPGHDPNKGWGLYMECEKPAVVDYLPKQSIAQWTLSGMMRDKPLPLTAYLDDGAPEAAFDNPHWPRDLRPPTQRSAGFVHQGSQWSHVPRYECIVSIVKEACLRAYRAGLEGVSIHGEVSSRHIPWALNYLAFSHFVHWPEDTLRDFGRKTLGQVLEDEDEGEAYAEALAHWHAGTMSEAMRKDVTDRVGALRGAVAAQGQDLERWRFWNWLSQVAHGYAEKHTVSFL